jgi:hypothetical protein
MPASGVSEQIIIDHLQDTVNFSQCNGQPYAGSFTRVRASDLILNPNIGLRIPDASMAPKNFRMATIIVSRDGLLSPQAMSFYSKFAFRAELRDRTPVRVGFSKTLGKPFYVSTRGLGTLQTRLTQDCSMTFDPAQLNIGRAGGTGSFIVNAPPTCSWSAIAAQTYLGLVNSHGQGAGTVTFQVAANTGPARGGSIVDGGSVPFTQARAGSSVHPSTGTGFSQTFVASFERPNPAVVFSSVYILVASSISTSVACFIEYNVAGNSFRLLHGEASGYGPRITPGSGSIENRQCRLEGGGATAVAGGAI